MEEDLDTLLGTAFELLWEEGKTQPASLLLDVQGGEEVFIDVLMRLDGGDEMFAKVDLKLEVPVFLLPRFTDDVVTDLLDALRRVALDDGTYIDDLRLAPVKAESGWRERAERNLSNAGEMNQGLKARSSNAVVQDGLRFASAEEVHVYRALRRAQKTQALTFFPLAAAVLPSNRFEPDFLMLVNGRAGVIEVDGPHHRGRAAADRSRDRLLEDNGVRYVDRVTVEETTTPAELDAFIDRFINRLASGG